MKKFLFLTSVISILAYSAVSQAIVINSGSFGGKYTDYSYADFDYSVIAPGILPPPPTQTGTTPTGNVWGIVSMTGIHTLIDNNPENNALSGVAYYNPGSDGKYYFGVYGGLTYLSGTQTTDIRLEAAAGQTPYLNIYETTNPNLYDLAAVAGSSPTLGGAFGTFGKNIIYGADGLPGGGDDPTLWLQTTFSPNTLAAYDSGFAANPTELELITYSSSVTGSAESYLDIIGGTGAALFEKGVFDMGGVLTGSDRADLKVISDLTAMFNAASGTWTQFPVGTNGWTTNSQDPITGVGASNVPEPSTILLLGAGLLGIGFFGRKKNKV